MKTRVITTLLIALGMAGNCCADITTSLVERWKFDDGSGGTAAGVNGNTLTLSGSPLWASTGRLGGALILDGSNDRGQCTLAFSTASTISSWIKIAAYPTHQAMIGGWSGNAEPTFEFSTGLGINSTGHTIGYVYDGNTKIATGSTVLSTGVWYHIAATFANSGNITVYVNGVSDGTTAIGTQYNTWTTGPVFKVGGSTGGSGAGAFENFLNAQIDDLRVYSRVLSTDMPELPATGRVSRSRTIGLGGVGRASRN